MPLRVAPGFCRRWLPGININRFVNSRRLFHDGKADFITIESNGSLPTRQLHILIGDPRDAYIILDKDVGFAMRSSIVKQTGLCLVSDPEKVTLAFFHDSRHFAHNACS